MAGQYQRLGDTAVLKRCYLLLERLWRADGWQVCDSVADGEGEIARRD